MGIPRFRFGERKLRKLCSSGAATTEHGLRLGVADHNVQETENIIFDGAHAAGARINLDTPPRPVSSTPWSRVNADIMDPQLVELR